MIVISGQVAAVGQQNLTLCPRAHAHSIRCSYIEMTDGRRIDGPIQMDNALYDALQSGEPMTVAVYPGGLFFRRSLQSILFTDGRLICNHEATFKRFFTLAATISIVLYTVVYGYFSQIIDSESGFRAAGVTLLLWLMLTSLAWLQLQRGRHWQRVRQKLRGFHHRFR